MMYLEMKLKVEISQVILGQISKNGTCAVTEYQDDRETAEVSFNI